jgi:signal transduction histidine kinase
VNHQFSVNLGNNQTRSAPRTFFAPPERSSASELAADVSSIIHNPLVDGLMYVANGLFAVLNGHRQIVALNESFLKLMGIEDASTILGLRPGEYVHCVHACEMPDGCGTSPYCATCGAVISIISALATEQPQEGTCSVTVEKDNKEVDLFFQVRCCPVRIEDKKFILMFLHDVSIQQQRANLESTFFHDINNLMTGILGKSELFQQNGVWDAEHFAEIQRLIQRTVQEFSMQQALSSSMSQTYQPLYCSASVNSLLNDLAETFAGHPATRTIRLDIARPDEPVTLLTDPAIVERILVNMVTNAIEATEPGGMVKVFIEPEGNSINFCVWNQKHIPDEHTLRIFKRNFSTKNGLGHGLGTYSMKFFGEKVLGGQVNFSTSADSGTVFRLTLMQG